MALYAEPSIVEDLSQCHFYHMMDFPGGVSGRGNWDLRGRFERYTANVNFTGKRVLDVGAASGFLTFEAEKRGAEVVSFDSSSPRMHAGLPFIEVRRRGDGSAPDGNENYETGRNAYWYAHRAYGSRAKCYYGDVYNLPDELGEFDIVLVGQILAHLRDPVSALTSITRRCRDKLVIMDNIIESKEPVMRFMGNPQPNPNVNKYNTWWSLSLGLYDALLQILGFKLAYYVQNDYPWQNAAGLKVAMRVATLGAERVEPVV
jgi:SAM-dependent methyltransferase